MSNFPFKSPRTDPTKNRGSPESAGSPLKAVLTGLAVDIGGSALLGVLLSAVYALQMTTADMTESQLHEVMDHIPPDSAIAILGNLLGALMSVAGGYVCARIVRRDEYRVGLVMTAISALFALLLDSGHDADDLGALLVLCTVACNMLGVKYGTEHNRRLEAPATPPADTPTP
jgi:hypothetical protein